MSGSPDPTLRSSLQAQLIPDQDLDEKRLDKKLSELTLEDINVILDHLNNLYIPSPSIRPHILPFLTHLYLTRPDLSTTLPHECFFTTLTDSLLLDDSPRLVEFGLRLISIVLPGSIVGFASAGSNSNSTRAGSTSLTDYVGFTSNYPSSSLTVDPTSSTSSFSGIGRLMSILGKAALLTTTTPQPSKHRRHRSGKADLSEGHGRSSSFATVRRDSQEPGAHLVSGLGLALSTQRQQHGDGEIEHEDDDEDQDQGDYLNPHDDDEDRLSFSPETIMSRLGGMMGRRDLVKERKLGPRTGGDGKVWKVFHDAGGGVQGRSSGTGDDEVQRGYAAGGSTFTTGMTMGMVGTTGRPTLSQTLSEYLSLLYTILPLNLVAFLSDPARFLDDKETGIRCPFEAAGGWKDVWKQGELGRILSPYMRSFLFNPAFLSGSAKAELDGFLTKFGKIEVDEIVGLAGSLSAIPAAHGLGESGSTGIFSEMRATSMSPTTRSRPNLPPRSMTGTTDMTDSSSFSGTPSAAARRRRSSELALPVTAANNPLMAMSTRTTAGGVNAYAVGAAHPIAIRSTGMGMGVMGGASEVELERLRRRVEELTLELDHQKRLAGMYLQHVNRLYHSAVSARSGEAEQQNLYNHIKDQERLSEQKNRELQSAKDELARTRKSSSEEKARLSAKMAENRELKKQVSAKQGARNDEILDKENLIEHLKSELSKEKEKNFKLDNRLREAEPKIKKIGDYEKQIDVFEENQLLWDEDIKTIQSQKDAVDKMTSAFVQMQNHTKAIQNEHDELVGRVRTLTEELVQCRANLEALQRRGRSAEPNQPDESSRSTAFFKDEMDSLKAKIEQAQMKIHDLEQEVLEAHADQEELDYLRRVQAQGKSSILA